MTDPTDQHDSVEHTMTSAARDRVIRELEAEVERLKTERAAQTYRGYSIGYIYGKMVCYQDQVGMAFAALRRLGWVDDAQNNDQRRAMLGAWTQAQVSGVERLKAELAKATLACRAMNAWFLAERMRLAECDCDTRMNLCDFAEHTCREVLTGLRVEYEGVPKLMVWPVVEIQKLTREQALGLVELVEQAHCKEKNNG